MKAWILSFCAVVVVGALSSSLSSSARASAIEVLPESRHQQYSTYGLFIDNQSMMVQRNAARAWAAIGNNIALFSLPDVKYQPQIILLASANAAFRTVGVGMLLTETIDARIGLHAEFPFDEKWRMSIGWTHFSGHVTDNVLDRDLFGPNSGDELVHARVVHDIRDRWRMGLTLKPLTGSDPGMKAFGSDQFAEWFPLGQAPERRTGRPFIAAGFEEYGRNRVELATHAQVGYFFGNHFEPKHDTTLRTVLGVYSGMDPRLKYYQFKTHRILFGYLGLMFDL